MHTYIVTLAPNNPDIGDEQLTFNVQVPLLTPNMGNAMMIAAKYFHEFILIGCMEAATGERHYHA